jgi:uncharacterized membrane protein YhaH (DUF805 family)
MSAKKTSRKSSFDVIKKSYITVFEKYFVLKGRARRREFWLFFLCNIVIGVVLGILPVIGVFISGLYSLVIIIPSFTVGVRRLHDRNRSGFCVLLSLIPIVGIIILIVWAAQEGTRGKNKYGPNPKGRGK